MKKLLLLSFLFFTLSASAESIQCSGGFLNPVTNTYVAMYVAGNASNATISFTTGTDHFWGFGSAVFESSSGVLTAHVTATSYDGEDLLSVTAASGKTPESLVQDKQGNVLLRQTASEPLVGAGKCTVKP